jgi:hypothetical protein
MTICSITYRTRRDASWLMFAAAMKHGAAQAGVNADVTLARGYAR